MFAVPSTSASHSKFASIFDAALETYKRKTKEDLTSHPLLSTLQSCDPPETPMHAAVSAGQSDILLLLIEHGADLKARNRFGDTLHRARRCDGLVHRCQARANVPHACGGLNFDRSMACTHTGQPHVLNVDRLGG